MIDVMGGEPRTAYRCREGREVGDRHASTPSRSGCSAPPIGETLAHLEYMVIEDRLQKFMEDGVQYYTPPEVPSMTA